jgi:hypothetical protein
MIVNNKPICFRWGILDKSSHVENYKNENSENRNRRVRSYLKRVKRMQACKSIHSTRYVTKSVNTEAPRSQEPNGFHPVASSQLSKILNERNKEVLTCIKWNKIK